jgi:hypothetical protein
MRFHIVIWYFDRLSLSMYFYNQVSTNEYYILMSHRMQCGDSCEPGYGNTLLYEFNHIGNAVIIHGY